MKTSADVDSKHRRPPAMEADPEEMLQPLKAAERLDTTEATLRTWRHQGRGPVYYQDAAGRITYRRADLDDFYEARRPRRIVPGEKRRVA